MVDQISAANTDGVATMVHPLEVKQRFRADVVTEQDERHKLLALSNDTEAGLFLVPQVIE
jgi:aspartyl-tRNA(Asn)/glutamyl-tRNA(Gln) amidotransferase subunit C